MISFYLSLERFIEINEALEDDPSLINNDPFGAGWIIKVKVTNPSDIECLMDATSYEASIA